MSTVLQAASFAGLTQNPPVKNVRRELTKKDLLKEIKASTGWAIEWLSSKKFVLIDLPLGKVANPIRPDQNAFLSAITCAANSVAPIVVDINKKEVGALHGFFPKIIVVKGNEIYAAAETQGRETVKAWIGIDAAQAMKIPLPAAPGTKPAKGLKKKGPGDADLDPKEVPTGTPDTKMDAKKGKKKKKAIKADDGDDGGEYESVAASVGLRQPLRAAAVMAGRGRIRS